MDGNESLFDELLWQEYNRELDGKFPVWDISSEATILHLDVPKENEFWVNADGDERYTITVILVCKSKSEENTRYGFVLKCYVKSFLEVSEVKDFIKPGHHRITIYGWDERADRFLEIDTRALHLSNHSFTYISIADSYYV